MSAKYCAAAMLILVLAVLAAAAAETRLPRLAISTRRPPKRTR